jgi:predicted AlkP superfamily phosphohydrolase/phosphomutase
VLCLGLDGADYALVSTLIDQGRLPILAGIADKGGFGRLSSTLPAFTPTAWSSLMTGLNPGRHGVFGFSSNPYRGRHRMETSTSRGGAPLWRLLAAAGDRSAFVTVPLTFPPDPIGGIVVTGFGGPQRPQIAPRSAAHRIFESHPSLVTAVTPTGWWHDPTAFAGKLIQHAEQIGDVCAIAMELEPELRLLCVDFMSTDIAGHVFWHRLDETHPAHSTAEVGDELVRVYEAVDRTCGAVIEHAEWIFGEEPTVILVSDHGMRPVHWTFDLNLWLEQAGYLRRHDQQRRQQSVPGVELGRSSPRWFSRLRRLGDHPEVEDPSSLLAIDRSETRAYGFGYGGQVYLGEHRQAHRDAGFADELYDALSAIPHPETRLPAFQVVARDEIFHGPFLDRAPDFIMIPRDERIFIDITNRPGGEAFSRQDRIDTAGGHPWSGQHVVDGIVAAAGPGIRPVVGRVGAELTQIAPTLLALLGLDADFDSPPITTILADDVMGGMRLAVSASGAPVEEPAVSAREEAQIHEQLRALGYE